jgi:hypothetical protein
VIKLADSSSFGQLILLSLFAIYIFFITGGWMYNFAIANKKTKERIRVIQNRFDDEYSFMCRERNTDQTRYILTGGVSRELPNIGTLLNRNDKFHILDNFVANGGLHVKSLLIWVYVLPVILAWGIILIVSIFSYIT